MAASRFSTEDTGNNHDLVIPWSYWLLNSTKLTEVSNYKSAPFDTIDMPPQIGVRRWKASVPWYESTRDCWFAVCISSGGIALVLNGPFPYRGHWLVVLATILYIMEIVLLFSFLAILLAKWMLYPHVAVRRALSDPDELGTYAILPIALMTIGALTITQVSEGPWGGHAFTLAVIWRIGVVWVCVTCVVVLTVLFYTGNQADKDMTPVLFMAAVGMATAASEAGLITIYGFDMSSRLAVPQIIVGYFASGVAMFMATLLYTVYFHRLLAAGWPAPAKRAGLFILIGPCGQLATAFQLLGESANTYMRFPQYKPSAIQPPEYGTFWTQQTAQGVDGAGIFMALLLLGFDYLWFCIAIIGVVDVFVKRQATYTLTWWAIVFPTVTLTTAWLELASSMDSPTFRALVCALTIFLVIAFFVNLAFTLRGVANGSLIFGKSQLEIEEGMMKKAQDEMRSSKAEV
ncbi:C4-dicarboxylate transporter/malic acid transport protein [Aureobasidium pullulans]|nr:C4-dicarboxylate transporter/malic acid transport protein [Aureobasidium pullulans]